MLTILVGLTGLLAASLKGRKALVPVPVRSKGK